jgi:hypothetical protein
MTRWNWVVILSVVLAVALVVTVVGLLIHWNDIDAVMYATLGAVLGWCAGMLVAPYEHEKAMFAGYSKAVAGFASGYALAKIDKLWELTLHGPSAPLILNPSVQHRIVIGMTCFFLVGAIVFKVRSYMDAESSRGDVATVAVPKM